MSFFGRTEELEKLTEIDRIKKASLIVCYGRRRIGKSKLIEEFAKRFTYQVKIQGLAPREKQTNQDQLDHFANLMCRQLKIPQVTFKNWDDAFATLALQVKDKKILIFLDEISWMATHDSDFAGKLKVAWDLYYKNNRNLRLVICGSVSSWIEKNILNSKDFVGRISLELKVDQLPLKDCHQFWGKRKSMTSEMDKFRILSVTGGVPRYLEEIDYTKPVEKNIQRLCFTKDGLLFTEFDKIFNDIFERRAEVYKKIVKILIDGKHSLNEICDSLKMDSNGVIVQYLKDLETAGFIAREFAWELGTGRQKKNKSYFRIKDNYLRFYLKYIDPQADKIQKNLYKNKAIDTLPEYEIMMGFQFECLVLQNLEAVFAKLNLNPQSIINVGPYFQSKTKRQAACQIDLLIQTKSSLYLCELKYKNHIDVGVVQEVKDKVKKLKYSKKAQTIRPILIYVGEISSSIEQEDFFTETINFAELLE